MTSASCGDPPTAGAEPRATAEARVRAGAVSETAAEVAERTARAAGVRVTELFEIDDFVRVYRLFDEIWRSEPGNAPISVEMMRALSHTGNYVAGAYRQERLVGASVAFLAAPAGRVLHSHVTGAVTHTVTHTVADTVTGAATGRGVGFALKQHQRAWALQRGLERVTWTYDPLVRRNAHFNLTKLGARPVEYLPSFYGAMDDVINAGDESDRLLVSWPLTAPHVLAAAAGAPASTPAP
ncbi:hypothetical protein, partial [Streptosporangium carneum]